MENRRKLFIAKYLGECNGNGTQAAIAAGYSENGASVTASRLLADPKVRHAIDKQLGKLDLSTQARLQRLAKIADHEPDTITGSDVIKANQLILQVNGALQGKQQSSGITVNIGFIAQPGEPTALPSLTIDSTPIDVKVLTPQAQVVEGGE